MQSLPTFFYFTAQGEEMNACKDRTLLKQFAKYVSLSVLAMAAISCYILADTYFISLKLGETGLSALNLALPVYYFIHGTGLMLGMGGSTICSFYKSRNKAWQADRIFTCALYLAAIFSVLFFAAGVFLSDDIATLSGADSQTFAMTEIYIRVLLYFSPAFILNNVLVCFIRNDGAPRLAMLSTVCSSLSNVISDYILIIICNMGMFGAVLATGLAPVIGIAISSAHFIRRKNTFRAVKCVPDIRGAGKIFALGFPSLVEQFSAAIVILVFNFIILDISGNAGVAAYGIVANISLVTSAVFSGVSQGIQPLISRAHGEGDTAREKVLLKYAIITGVILAAIIYAVLFSFAKPLAEVFNSGNSPDLTLTAAEGIRIYFSALIFLAVNVVACTFFSSTERPLPAHIISLLRGLIAIIPSAYILSALKGFTGVWLAFPATEAITAVVCAAMLAVWLKKHIQQKN